MTRQDVLNIYKIHLDKIYPEVESRAIMLWVNDYIKNCSDSEFLEPITLDIQVEDDKLIEDIPNILIEDIPNKLIEDIPNILIEDIPNTKVFEALIRLLNFEPVQYVFQTAYFHKYQFKVNSTTLIPRPETEELIELILQYNNHLQDSNILGLDIGTGSGCIPITILKEQHSWKFKAIDISEGALKIAQTNSIDLHVSNRIQFENCNILERDMDFSHFHLIISNPPYIPYSELNKLDMNVTKYEPHIALFTDSDPLIFYKRIAHLATKSAQKGTQIWLETHQDYCEQVAQLFEAVGTTTKIEDLSGNPRFVKCVKN